MAVDIDSDTLAAVVTLWTTDATLPGLFKEPIRSGRIKAPQATGGVYGDREFPYAQATCELDRRELSGTGGAWFDYRKVTLRAWGKKDQASAALAAMLARFNLGLPSTADAAGRATIVFPSGERFIQFWPLDGGTIAEDKDVKAGFDVWVATVTGRVWSIRAA